MFVRRIRKSVAKALLALFLCAQALLAFAACDWSERSAARALGSIASSEPCHSDREELNANLCIAHCTAGNQSLDKPTVKIPAAVVSPVFVVASRPASPVVTPTELPLAIAGPPPRILFRTLRI